MTQCPICQTKIKNQDYCPNCAWEFEYYFDELSEESKSIYEDRFKIWSGIYSRLSDFEKGLIASKTILKRFPFEPEMVLIKGGSFMTERNDKHLYPYQEPIYEVSIDYDLEIGKYPVTFEEYDYFCEETKREKPYDMGWGRGKRPVINITWKSVEKYIEWLSKKTNKKYRLPTEDEWEYVARAGTTTKWSFGDDENILKEYAWYIENSHNKSHEVGMKKSNQWGVYDIYGNVYEMQGIRYSKILKGGSWDSKAYLTYPFHKISDNNKIRFSSIGFRLIRILS